MDKEILNKRLDNYLDKIKKIGETEELNERELRVNYYRSYTKDRILTMDIEEFYDFLGNLWAMGMWGDKKSKIDQLIKDNNGFDKLKFKIAELLYGENSIEDRWDNFKDSTKGFGPAIMSELLCHVYPNNYMLWNRTAKSAYKLLGMQKVPMHDYQITGKRYIEMTNIAKGIQKIVIEKGYEKADLLFVDYFFWDQLNNGEQLTLDLDGIKETVVNNKSYHNEIVDYIKSIGSLLGYNSSLKGNIKNSGKIADAIWEFNVGNLGKIKYVFEVQDSGSIDSLIVSLMNASQDISVQAVVAVSDEQQINKIKQHCNNIEGSFNGKLKFWNINEVERAYTELSSSMEIINRAINVKIDN